MNWSAINHGLPSLPFAYAVTGVPMLAGFLRQRTGLPRILASPLIAVPVTVAALAAWAAVSYFWSANAAMPEKKFTYWFATAFLATLGFMAGVLIAGKRVNAAHKRGALVEEGGRSRVRPGQVSLAGMAIRSLDETKDFKLIGATGKSTAIRALLAGALARGDRVIIADPDAGYLERFYDATAGDVIMNPFGARSARWDLLAEIDHPYDVEQLARALIPDQDGQDENWRGYARTLVTGHGHHASAVGAVQLRRAAARRG